ncbi:MAG: ABC transporter permease [Bacillota bacterium]|jgi:peptide/nickel transport system permease protein|nr:ABC transporter permease [Bacillota bacterium]NLH31653.1 ABC transporter permease [Bacillota bacterium]
MLRYIVKRIVQMIPILFMISIISFIIIQLPPGSYLNTLIAQMRATGDEVDMEMIEALRIRYSLDKPMHIQYFNWMKGIITRGDFGFSFEWNRPVSYLIWERLGLSVAVSVSAMLFSWIIAFPIAIYSAVRKHTLGDYFFTFVGFLGLSTPNFMLALILMFISSKYFGFTVGGLFSPEYMMAPWSWARFVDMLTHIWIPMIVVGTAGTAGLIRVLRNNLLDELGKPYVVAARSKGISTVRLVFKYPVRLALIPFISTVGWQLPNMVSGEAVTATVLSLPTAGPLMLAALRSQDMYLAGSFLLLLALLTMIGTLISDLLLVLVDPRIRYE